MNGQHRFNITIVDDGPQLTLIVDTPTGFRKEVALYDTAEVKFQPMLQNELRRIIQQIQQQRKDRINYVIPSR